MIRNCMFRRESFGISYFWVKIFDSGHAQVAIYTVFHEESESAVKICQFLHPEEKIKKNQPTRVSISYRKRSYRMSPPYLILVCVSLDVLRQLTVETYDKKFYDKKSRLS